jgi:EAL domain-containing protein (putative c-di-GMP-specific phosphodiesterase class I)
VECLTERRFLEQQGCDEIQGYLFTKPLSPEAFIAYVARTRDDAAAAGQRQQAPTA